MNTNELVNLAMKASEQYPGAKLVRNAVGNLVVTDDDGCWIAYLDLIGGEIGEF